jgi:predicted Fe-S protein YdhL (DUF1289 family)
MATIENPCTKVCTIDPASGLCIGCGRTLDEIARWLSLAESERRRIIDELPARLRCAKRPAAPARA